ncbi:CoA pyrophosphatase [bacterium]|nr:MAG: CoA pyrophosphatase [bacterium]
MIIQYSKFFDYLDLRLKSELPSTKAHIKMVPFGDIQRLDMNIPREDAKKSAVLILINDKFELLLTLRSHKLRNHSGQISFPGGRSENDETYEQTALRETEEEVGISRNKIKLIGRLSNIYVPPSNNIIQPVVGHVEDNLHLLPNPDEVEEAFYVPIDYFLDEKNIKVKKTEFGGKPYTYPYWDIHRNVPLWGATAIMMSEFIYLVNEFRENNS